MRCFVLGREIRGGRRGGGGTRGCRTAVRSMCEGRQRERDCQTGSENRPGVLQGDLTMKHMFFSITVVPASNELNTLGYQNIEAIMFLSKQSRKFGRSDS